MITSNGYALDEDPTRFGALEPVPLEERNDRDALWSRLRREGYLYLTGHLDRENVEQFREYYFSSLRSTGLVAAASDPRDGLGTSGPVDLAELRRILYDDIIPGHHYNALTTQPRIRDWFSWLLGDDVHLHKRRIIRHTRAGESGIGTATQAHYDLVYLREGTDRVLSMWIPLGDCPVSRGGLLYLERSHRRVLEQEAAGTLPHPARSITADLPRLAEEHDARWLAANYAAGDVVVHSAHIIHASGDNSDPDGVMRLSTDIRYQRLSEPIDWRWQNDWNEDDGL